MWGALARFLEARYPPSPWRRRARRRGVPGPRTVVELESLEEFL